MPVSSPHLDRVSASRHDALLAYLSDESDLTTARIAGLTTRNRSDNLSKILERCNSLFAVNKTSFQHGNTELRGLQRNIPFYHRPNFKNALPERLKILPCIKEEEPSAASELSNVSKGQDISNLDSSIDEKTDLHSAVIQSTSNADQLNIITSDAPTTPLTEEETSQLEIEYEVTSLKAASKFHDSGIDVGSRYGYSASLGLNSAASSLLLPGDPPKEYTSERQLPCEFSIWGSCMTYFAIDQVQDWIDHIVCDHLAGILPTESLCWFCDASFGTHAFELTGAWLEQPGPWDRFKIRMEHIRGHILDRPAITDSIRPDRNLLNMILEHGFIDKKTYSEAIKLEKEWKPRALPQNFVREDIEPLELARRRVVDAIYRNLCSQFDRAFAIAVAASEGDAAGQELGGEPYSSSTPTASTSQSTHHHHLKLTSSGKRKARNNFQSSDNGSDGSSSQKRIRPNPSSRLADASRGFTCPFLQKDLDVYSNERSCINSWPTVRRVKEHLWRVHFSDVHQHECPRCHERFKQEKQLDTHLITLPACQLRNLDYATITKYRQADGLRNIKLPRTSERAKWNKVYEILFPEVSPENYPSPELDFIHEISAHNFLEGFTKYVHKTAWVIIEDSIDAVRLNINVEKRRVLVQSITRGIEKLPENYFVSQQAKVAASKSSVEIACFADFTEIFPYEAAAQAAELSVPTTSKLEKLTEPISEWDDVPIEDDAIDIVSYLDAITRTVNCDSGYGTSSACEERHQKVSRAVDECCATIDPSLFTKHNSLLIGPDGEDWPPEFNNLITFDVEHGSG
ncbi:hypothetical protein BX600DRAFT_501594 [Xylariales sp. PMI_506]|nr:hypothetical protein BX600DRAFT_501594 [Xylariales sp. PMI_506]